MITPDDLRTQTDVCLRAGAESALHFDAGSAELVWLQGEVRRGVNDRRVVVADFYRRFVGSYRPEWSLLAPQVSDAFDVLWMQQMEFRRWQARRDPDIADLFPASELVELIGGVVRGWREKWLALGGRMIDGRCVALKGDTIWKTFSDYGHPYPPFEWSGSLSVADVSRRESEKIGLRSSG